MEKIMKIAITSESVCDLNKEFKEKYNIQTLPFGIILGDDEYFDGEIETSKIFEYVKASKKLPSTSAVNEYQYEEFFKNILNDYDAIIHISMSDHLSCAVENARKVANRMENVNIINSKSLSFGMGLLAIYACELRDKGLSVDEIVSKLEERKKAVQVSLILEKLDYLKKGGRCSTLQLLGANLLMLRPELIVNEGKLISSKKFRGNFKRCCEEYCDDILERFNNPDLSKVFLAFTTLTEDIKQVIREKLKAKGFKNIIEAPVGCTISCHCGENGLGVIYMNDGDKFN